MVATSKPQNQPYNCWIFLKNLDYISMILMLNEHKYHTRINLLIKAIFGKDKFSVN